MIKGTVKSVGKVTVGDDRDQGDAGIQYLAAVKRDLPLSDQDWAWGNEPRWDGEKGQTEDTACKSVRDVRERRLPLPLLRIAAHQSRMPRR